eukprot:GHVN01019933.1.p1 GENE.GHVN01019933.1~~GHVN01019933.1.p1  ORF type:complete len:150 (+),score=39.02 GHVN01019933.1:109-558(+)
MPTTPQSLSSTLSKSFNDIDTSATAQQIRRKLTGRLNPMWHVFGGTHVVASFGDSKAYRYNFQKSLSIRNRKTDECDSFPPDNEGGEVSQVNSGGEMGQGDASHSDLPQASRSPSTQSTTPSSTSSSSPQGSRRHRPRPDRLVYFVGLA